MAHGEGLWLVGVFGGSSNAISPELRYETVIGESMLHGKAEEIQISPSRPGGAHSGKFGQGQARSAANRAAAAFPAWSATAPEKRAEILRKTADLILAHVDEFCHLIALEIGGSETWARFNCELGARILRQAATICFYPVEINALGGHDGVSNILLRQPVGVVLGIAPWNAPVILGIRAIAAPLACGNTVVLKASELCPQVHELIIDLLHRAGLPQGTACIVTNTPEEAADTVEALVSHTAIRRVNFTGSTRVGRLVAETCARHLKPAILELSGKAALIVRPDADLARAAEAAAYGAFFNQGQVCISTERIVADIQIADAFVANLAERASGLTAGDPRHGDFDLGTLISADSANRVMRLVEDALDKGAVLVAGGIVDNKIMQPTVLDHVDSSMQIYSEESFGPVAAILRSSGDDESISIANDTQFGLAASIFSSDLEAAHKMARQLECGICHINGPTVYDDPAMPFGGMKDSGYGKLGGDEAVREFTELRWIAVHSGSQSYIL